MEAAQEQLAQGAEPLAAERLVTVVEEHVGALAGLVLAEIELSDPDEAFAKPDWLGAEVTSDLRYRNAALAEHGLP